MPSNPFKKIKKPKAPPIIDPRQVLADQTKLNRYNTGDPFGSTTWSTDPNGTPSYTTTLSASQQAQLSQRERIAASLLENVKGPFSFENDGKSVIGPLSFEDYSNSKGVKNPLSFEDYSNSKGVKGPLSFEDYSNSKGVKGPLSFEDYSGRKGPFSFEDDSKTEADAFFGRQKLYLDPERARQRERHVQDLQNQGLPVGSEAYNDSTKQFDDNWNTAYASAGHGATLAGHDASLAKYNANLAGYGANLAGYDSNLAGYGATLAGYDSNLAGYDATLAGYGANLAGYDATLAGSNAALQNRQQSSDEALQRRQQLMSEIAGIYGGQPGPGPGSTGPIDVTGAHQIGQNSQNTAYQGRINTFNQKTASRNNLINGIVSLGSAAILGPARFAGKAATAGGPGFFNPSAVRFR